MKGHAGYRIHSVDSSLAIRLHPPECVTLLIG